MNATIQQRAVPNFRNYVGERARPCIIAIDGTAWESPLPENSGEAQSFNEDAERIVEAVKRK